MPTVSQNAASVPTEIGPGLQLARRDILAGEADFGARNVYSVQLPRGAVDSDFGHTLERIIAPLGANVDPRPALGGGDDIRELQSRRGGGIAAPSAKQERPAVGSSFL